MQIPLDHFEQHIDETILKRGLAYYKKGLVTDFHETSYGAYSAKVCGSEIYSVELKVQKNTVIRHLCDCPYDTGPICKHIAATIFELQKEALSLLITEKPKKKAKRPKSKIQQINERLTTLSKEDLAEFILNNAKEDNGFKKYFIASFGHLNQVNAKASYKKQIQHILKAAKSRDGWIDRNRMKYVVKAIEPIIENAKNLLATSKHEHLFYISSALLEELIKALQYADDSNGELGYLIDESYSLLTKLTEQEVGATLKKTFFEHCINTYKKKTFEGWDWHLGMLENAFNLIETEGQSDRLLSLLEKVDGQYQKESAQALTLKVLRTYKSKDAVTSYINRHISNAHIRQNEIKLAFANKNFERVTALAQDGIAYDQKDKPGLVKKWYNWLLKVAQANNDIPKIIEYARLLFIDNFYPEQDYYQILKNNVKEEDWHTFLEHIITELTPNTQGKYTDLIREIYIKEKWYSRLFLMLKENASLGNIEQNEQYLKSEYATQLVELYAERISSYLERYVGRNHYVTACRYLRRMKKLGGEERVGELIEIYREKYKMRPALLDELSRV